jgi:ABC-2 type transport system permease protein
MNKVLHAAMREYKATALTKAFFFGAVVFPLVFFGAIVLASASGIFDSEKPPLEGRIAVVDGTGGAIADQVAAALDPEVREQRLEEARALLKQQRATNPLLAMVPEEQLDLGMEAALKALGLDRDMKVGVEVLGADATIASLGERLSPDAEEPLLAYAVVGTRSLELPPPKAQIEQTIKEMGVEVTDELRAQMGLDEPAPDLGGGPETLRAGELRIVHQKDLDPDYVSLIRREFVRAVEDERYRRRDINPQLVRQLEAQSPIALTYMVGEDGSEEESTAGVSRLLPLAFFFLLYMSVLTGGTYLFYGTLEEKGSRVMEVLLSAVSPMQLMVGKIIGQGLVGLTMLGIYVAIGLFAVERFDYWSAVPAEALVWMLPYFLMAYLFFGALYIAIGSAVTEIREASALQAPLLMLILVLIVILFPILENPGSPVARVMSYFPPTTPFVMVMRLSQPSHVVPWWEIAATGVLGFAGVLFTVWLAAKIFRVGVLMYGKPPSFGTLLKWVRQS